ncbi:hypothetical protein [Cryptosporangium sp. NPDC048952]|uniref:hypothetical protein n=1 Tax=Cryptosporangium sp. NPDC048952 TaxID=3363961 RepID=UPI00371DC36C
MGLIGGLIASNAQPGGAHVGRSGHRAGRPARTAQQTPGVLAASIAPLVLTAGMAGDAKNYPLLFVLGGVLAFVGAASSPSRGCDRSAG